MTTSTKQLTTQQLTILKIIYKFRFVTSDLIAHYRTTSRIAAYKSLTVLHKSGYIERRSNIQKWNAVERNWSFLWSG